MLIFIGMMTNYDLQAPIFVGEEYSSWKVKMRHFLIAKGLWDCIIVEYEEPEYWSSLVDEERRRWKEEQHQNCIALLEIKKGLAQNTFPFIASCRTTASAWKRLQDVFGTDFDACVSKGDSYEDQPCCEEFCEHFCVKKFEETYEVLTDFYVERGYVNEGEGANVVPSIINDVNVVVPDLFYDDCFLEEAYNVPKLVY